MSQCSAYAQKNNAFRYGLRVSREIDGPLKFIRHQAKSDYAYNWGLGSFFHYQRKIAPKITGGIETGYWYFWNEHKSTDALGLRFTKRSSLIPVMATLHFVLYQKNKNTITLGVKGGMVGIQNKNFFSDKTVQSQIKLSPILEGSLSFHFMTKRFRYVHVSLFESYFDKRYFNALAWTIRSMYF